LNPTWFPYLATVEKVNPCGNGFSNKALVSLVLSEIAEQTIE
jgi:hypothetical protein